MMCLYRTRPYEAEPWSATGAVRSLDGECKAQLARGCEARGVEAHGSSKIVEDFDTLAAGGRGNQAARRRGRRDLGEVPSHGEQPDRRRDRARRLRGRGSGSDRVLPVRHCRRHLPERPAGPFRQGRGGKPHCACGRIDKFRKPDQRCAACIAAFRARLPIFTSWPDTRARF